MAVESREWLMEYEKDGYKTVRKTFGDWKTKEEAIRWFWNCEGYRPMTCLCVGESRVRDD